MGYTFKSGADSAWVADETGDPKLKQIYLRSAQISNLLTLIGIFTSTALAVIDLQLPIIIGGCMFLCLGILLIPWMPETRFKPICVTAKNTFGKMLTTFIKGTQMISSSHLLLIMIAFAAFEGLCSEGFDRL